MQNNKTVTSNEEDKSEKEEHEDNEENNSLPLIEKR